MKMRVRRGRGYEPVSVRKLNADHNAIIGALQLDASFSPIVKVRIKLRVLVLSKELT
jgi:DNA-directed RNA polymerase subunit alpha (EC 2.7.7.6)